MTTSRLTTLYRKHFGDVEEKKTEARVNVIRHMGFHNDGLWPKRASRMYKILVRSILEYVAQVLSYKHYLFHRWNRKEIEEPKEFIKTREVSEQSIGEADTVSKEHPARNNTGCYQEQY